MSAKTKRPASKPSGAPAGANLLLDWRLTTIAAVLITLVAEAVVYARYVRIFRLTNDDFALVWNSVLPYMGASGPVRWFTEGYSEYFRNFPDWPSGGFPFVRPLANLAFFVGGLFEPVAGEGAYLLVSLVTPVVATWLMMLALRRYTNMSPWLAALFSVAFGLAPIWYQAGLRANMVTNSLGTLFSLAAVVVLDARRGMPEGRRLYGCLALLVLAIWGHETAAVMPFVCAALIWGMAPERPRVRELLVLAVPLLPLAVHQLMLSDGTYYVFSRAESGLGARLKDFIPGPLFPFNEETFSFIPRPLPPELALPFYLGVALNVFALGVLVASVRLRPLGRAASLVAAILIAMVPSLLMFGLPRFGGFVAITAGIVLLYLTAAMPRVRTALVVAVLATHVVLLVSWSSYVDDNVAQTVEAGQFVDQLEQAVQREQPQAIVLVNDTVGLTGSAAMLKLAAWPAEVDWAVLNNLGGPPDPAAGVSVEVVDGVLNVTNVLGARQWISAQGAEVAPDTPNQGFTYQPIPGAPGGGSFMASRPLGEGTTLVVGIDPATGAFFGEAVGR